jgi:tetratricopeptide (TPR) repeat protein
LYRAVEFLRRRVQQLKASPLNDATQLELAEAYESLGEDENAEQALRSLAERSPAAALRIAEIHLRQKRPDSSRLWAEKTLQLAQAAQPSDNQQRALMENIELRAYDMLAVFAGEKAEFERAESYLQEALERLPTHAAHIHDRLAKHYEFIGELKKSQDHQQKAADLDPERYSPPEALMRKMLSTGAPVGLARPKSSRYQ